MEYINSVQGEVEAMAVTNPLVAAAFYDESSRWCLKASESSPGRPTGMIHAL